MRTVRVNETSILIVPLYMQSIQVGSTMVAEIMYAVENIGSMRTKGVNVKIILQYTAFH